MTFPARLGLPDIERVPLLLERQLHEALSRTTPRSGLADQDIEVIVHQLRFNREHGTILQSDAWIGDQSTPRRDSFVQVA